MNVLHTHCCKAKQSYTKNEQNKQIGKLVDVLWPKFTNLLYIKVALNTHTFFNELIKLKRNLKQ